MPGLGEQRTARPQHDAEAGQGERALQRTQQLRPGVVLLDGWLPGALDGIALAERIQAAR
jgi:CheY-like chemotaxis protein